MAKGAKTEEARAMDIEVLSIPSTYPILYMRISYGHVYLPLSLFLGTVN